MHMNIKKIISLALAMIMVLSLAACGDQGSGTTTAPSGGGDTIKLALLAPLTGQNAEYGKGFEVATKMAIDEINAAGGVKGKMLEIVVGDSKGEPKESSDLARQYADDQNIMAIVGDFSSGASMANAPIVDAAGLVQISPTASNPEYAGMSPYTFSIMGRQDAEGPFVAKYILDKKIGAKDVSIMYINSDWGVPTFEAVSKEIEAIGLNIVSTADYVSGETDYSSVITKAKAGNPDTVLILDQGALPQILNQMAQGGWTDVNLVNLGAGASQQVIDLTGDNSDALYTSTPFFFDPTNEKDEAWKNKFKELAGFEPTVHPVCAYDCVYVLAEAMNKIEGEITREAIREKVQETDYVGMTGPIKFNPAGDVNRQYLITQVIDGKWELVEGYDYSAE